MGGLRTVMAAQSRSLMLTFLAVALSFGGLILAAVRIGS